MCSFIFLRSGYCGAVEAADIVTPPTAPARPKRIKGAAISNSRTRLYAMAIKAWLREGEKREWDYWNCRRSWL